MKPLALFLAFLLALPAVAAPSDSHSAAVVTYAGDDSQQEFNDVIQLSDGSLLIAGSTERVDWLQGPKTILKANGIEDHSTGRSAILLHVSKDLAKVIGSYCLPQGMVRDFRWIKTTNKPGEPTGTIYVSGACEEKSGGYFIARLDGNFVNSKPTGFKWVKSAKTTRAKGDNLGLQVWDCGSDGRLAYADETGETIRVFFLKPDGTPDSLPDLRASHWPEGVPLDDGNRKQAVGSEVKHAKISAVSFPSDLRSWDDAERLAILPDGNGSIKRGTWPMDLFFPVRDKEGNPDPRGPYGYTGYISRGAWRVGAIAFDRDTHDFTIGFNAQSMFWDAKANKNQPDFEPAVITYAANGKLKWWSRLYHEVVDKNGNGTIDPGETHISLPDQYVDGLSYDHSTKPAAVVVQARCHGNDVSNFWQGHKIAANPKARGFNNQFTGTEGNIHIGWIGKLRGNDGTLLAASYVTGYFRHSKLTQKPYPESIHDGWPSHNEGWPNLTTTSIAHGCVRCDRHGRVSIVGVGPRMVTTRNAWQKMPRITDKVNEGISPWSGFIRVFEPELDRLAYSSAIVGKWTYPSEGAQPEGSGNTEIRGAFPIDEGVIAVGRHLAKEGKALGNPIPVNCVPVWGRPNPEDLSAIFAALPYEP